jgi:hypothetical protein
MNAYIINTETMQWPIYEGDYRNIFSGNSLPTPLVLEMPYAWVQDEPQPSYDWVTQGVKEVTPVEKDDVWTRQWEIYALSQEQIDANHEQQRQQNKQQAESLLQQTDWTENNSVRNTAKTPHLVNGDAFDDYRVALRGIAINPPIVVNQWPTKPEEQWSNV